MSRKKTLILSLILGLTLLGAGCGSSEDNPSPQPGGSGTGVSTGNSPVYVNQDCWTYGVVWYDGFLNPLYCQVAYNFWITGYDIHSLNFQVQPYDYVGIVGYVPYVQNTLYIFNSSANYYQWSMFQGGSWQNSWSNYWSYWYTYGFENSFNYQTHYSNNPTLTNTWPSVSIYLQVNGTPVHTFNGTNFIWNNSALTGSLSVSWTGGNPLDAYLIEVMHCEDWYGNTIPCPY